MKSPLIAAVLALTALACTPAPTTLAQTAPLRLPAAGSLSPEAQAALQALLAAPPATIGQTKIDVAMIQKIYQLSSGAPLWIGSQGLSAEAAERVKLLSLISVQHGLRATFYLGDDVGARKAAKEPPALAELEVLLTQAYLSLLTDLKTGRIQPANPAQNLADIEMKKNPPPVAQDVYPSATTEDGILNMVDRLRPQSVAYMALVNSLNRLRYARKQGGWPAFAANRPTLRPGASHPNVVGIRTRLSDLGYLPVAARASSSQVFDEALAQAVIRFRLHNFLGDEAVVGNATYKTLEVTLDAAIDQVRANLEKWRFFPRPAIAGESNPNPLPARFVFVDIGRQQLDLMSGNNMVFRKRVVVGAELHGTPTMSDRITSVIVNPYWYPPTSIIVKETIPAMLANKDYLRNMGMRIFQGSRELSPAEIAAVDWSRYTLDSPPPYEFRQDSGMYSALGNLKFQLTNSHAIYLHDTGNREAFKRERRFLSHGCIRVEKPVELAAYLTQNLGLTPETKAYTIEDFQAWFEDSNIHAEPIKIAPLPVFILGTTLSNFPAEPGTDPNGYLVLGPDIYKQDARIIAAMDGQVVAGPTVAPTSQPEGPPQ